MHKSKKQRKSKLLNVAYSIRQIMRAANQKHKKVLQGRRKIHVRSVRKELIKPEKRSSGMLTNVK